MNIEQCWSYYMKADELNKEGHWPEAHHLYNDVLNYLPGHIEAAVSSESTKPCQLMCLLNSYCDSTISQSEILNNLGQRKAAFDLLNQTYGYFQFLTLEPSSLVNRLCSELHNHSEELYRHISAFCIAQRSAEWMLELKTVEKTHHQFYLLQSKTHTQLSKLLN